MKQAIEAIRGDNPLVPYDDTCAMHALFDKSGLFEVTSVNMSSGYRGSTRLVECRRYAGETPLRYRVDHGNGYKTQHEWRKGQHACTIDNL